MCRAAAGGRRRLAPAAGHAAAARSCCGRTASGPPRRPGCSRPSSWAPGWPGRSARRCCGSGNPRTSPACFEARLRDLQVEEFHLLALDSQSQVLREVLVTRGLLNSSLVHPREVFRAAIAEAAAGIIVVHNHPSGDPTPSAEDRAVTQQLVGRGTPAGPAAVRPRHHRGRPLRELRHCRTAVTGTLPDLAPDLRAVLERHADRLDLDLIERALRFSASAHRGQKRMSGEDFVSHSIAVALILAEQLLDSTTIAAALLHDVVEDSDVRTEDIAREFGSEIAGHRRRAHQDLEPDLPLLRRGAGRELPQAAAVDRQGRARHHHQARRPAAQHADARAPAARAAEPHRAGDAGDLRAARAPLRHGGHEGGARGPGVQVPRARRVPRAREAGGVRSAAQREQTDPQAARRRSSTSSSAPASTDVEVTGRPKHLWSIFQKMRKRDKAFEEIYDLHGHPGHRAHRCPTAITCSASSTTTGRRMQERIKDYIAQPKSNGYQSLHTTIFGPGRAAVRGPDPHPGDAPHGRVRHRGALALQGGRQDPTSWTSTSAGSGSCSSCSRTRTAPRSSSSS